MHVREEGLTVDRLSVTPLRWAPGHWRDAVVVQTGADGCRRVQTWNGGSSPQLPANRAGHVVEVVFPDLLGQGTQFCTIGGEIATQ